jgi:hypothetical protein
MRETFKIVPYSKAKTVADVRKRLAAAPMQKDNSPEAFSGFVFEVINALGVGGVGTLAEVHQHYGLSELTLVLRDGRMELKRLNDGRWIEA